MGWDWTRATNYKENGKIDRIAEVRECISKDLEVVKDTMVGSVYYGAWRSKDDNSVFAIIAHTGINMKDYYFNFGVKLMSEDMGPCEADCPASILNCLTEPSNEWAAQWRERCRAKAAAKKTGKTGKSLASIPYGATIEFEHNGKVVRATKQEPSFQFKTAWFSCGMCYIPKKRIPADWRLVSA